MTPDDILPTYQRAAGAFARARDKTLFERRWLDRALAYAPGRRVLDLGCGPGLPMARYLSDRRAQITGVDGAPAMVDLFRANLPRAEAVCADMRGLDLGRQFDVILAWNSFFHLGPGDQRAMFPVFAAHAAPKAVLMFTAGPCAGEPIGQIDGAPVYHCSLEPEDYAALLDENGFDLLRFAPEDPDCNGHTVFLARRRVTA